MKIRKILLIFVLVTFFVSSMFTNEFTEQDLKGFKSVEYTQEQISSYEKIEIYYKDICIEDIQIISEYFITGYKEDYFTILGKFVFEEENESLFLSCYNRLGKIIYHTKISGNLYGRNPVGNLEVFGFSAETLHRPFSPEIFCKNRKNKGDYQTRPVWYFPIDTETNSIIKFSPK